MNILTYNISWQSMTGNSSDWHLCNTVDQRSDKYYGICINNIATFIDSNGPFDFIFLQEASNYELLIKQSKKLQTLSWAVHHSSRDVIVTFWNPDKFTIVENKIIGGKFKNGRPWIYIEFEENVSIINVHAPHCNKHLLQAYLEQMIKRIMDFTMIKRLIMCGDFNFYFKKSITLNNIKLHKSRDTILTCCSGINMTYQWQFDHVFDSKTKPIKIFSPKVNGLASDHKPLIAILES
jgi:endonuclease/exonuclease/phosphatase family metal-dependent hydrolase